MSDRGYVAVDKYLEVEKERDELRARVAELERENTETKDMLIGRIEALRIEANDGWALAERHRVERNAAIKERDEYLAGVKRLAKECAEAEMKAQCLEMTAPPVGASIIPPGVLDPIASELVRVTKERDEARAKLEQQKPK